MAEEPEIYTGYLTYKNIRFFFTFDKEQLCLTPQSEDEDKVFRTILSKQNADGSFSWPASPKMDEAHLVGKCSSTGQSIIFITRKGFPIHHCNSVLYVDIEAYIVCRPHEQKIAKISFTSPELNYIHPTTQAYGVLVKEETQTHGSFSIVTKDFDVTTTDSQSFQIDGKEVLVRFGIQRGVNYGVGKPPLSLSSTLVFSFEPTDDYAFIMKAWYVAKEFLQFLCYRKNTYLPIVELSQLLEDEKYSKFATLYVMGETGDAEPRTLKQGRYIKLSFILGKEGNILHDIASRKLYVSHIPETHASGNRIDTSRFLLIMAAFEGEYCRLYSKDAPQSDKRLNARAEVKAKIEELIQTAPNRRVKEEYEFLCEQIDRTSLEERIKYVGTKLDSVIGIFGKHWYDVEDMKSIYTKMANRLVKQRNNYAHGNLNFTFTELLLLDIVYMERIVYAMQLKYYGVEEKNIQHAINDLFHCCIGL